MFHLTTKVTRIHTQLLKIKLKKEVVDIKPISKNEAMYLRGCGYKDYVQKAVCCKSYYVVEDSFVLNKLKEYRDKIITYSYFK